MSMDETILNGDGKNSKFRTTYFPNVQMIKYEYKPFDTWEVYFWITREGLQGLMANRIHFAYVETDAAAVINDPLRLKRFYKIERVNQES